MGTPMHVIDDPDAGLHSRAAVERLYQGDAVAAVAALLGTRKRVASRLLVNSGYRVRGHCLVSDDGATHSVLDAARHISGLTGAALMTEAVEALLAVDDGGDEREALGVETWETTPRALPDGESASSARPRPPEILFK